MHVLSSFPSAIPQQWHMENIARLLVLCGSNNCCNVLGRKAINGKFLEIAQITMYIIMVSILVVFMIGYK